MRLLLVTDPRRPLHPARKLLREGGIDGACGIDGTTLEKFVFFPDEPSETPPHARATSRLIGDRAKVGVRCRDGKVSLVEGREMAAEIRHARKIVVCLDAFGPFAMTATLKALARVNPHAECALHPFYAMDGASSALRTVPFDATRDLLGKPEHGNFLLHHETVAAAAERLISHRLTTEALHRCDVSPTLAEFPDALTVQILFWLRRSRKRETGDFRREGETPFKAAMGPYEWRHFCLDGRSRGLFDRQTAAADEYAFAIGPRGLAFLSRIAPGLEDPDFAERLTDWTKRGIDAARPEIDAYLANVSAVQAAYEASSKTSDVA